MSDHCHGAKDKLVTLGAKRAPEYWKSPEDLRSGPLNRGEFPGGLPSLRSLTAEAPAEGSPASEASDPGDKDGSTRRDFLTLMGFGVSAAGMAACRPGERKAIPLPVASDDMIAGVANYYATTCGGCASACSLLVKQRDGRPIKIEGNDASVLFGGATCATGQATVLSLYDQERLHGPLWDSKPAEWAEVDDQIAVGLKAAAAKGKIVLLSSTLTSPSLRDILARWAAAFPGFSHVVYDPISASALRTATGQMFGKAAIPHYAFDRARVIVSLDADFLGTWLSPVEFARQYAAGRAVDKPESLHIQFESGLSVTGSNADRRVMVPPSAIGGVALGLLARLARLGNDAEAATIAPAGTDLDTGALDAAAAELWKHRGESLVVSGVNDVAIQVVIHQINKLLGNVGQGKTVDLDRPSLQRQGDDAAMAELVAQMQRGEIQALILHGVNPVYDYVDGAGFATALAKVPLTISTADRRDETAALVHAVVPDHHFLESWGDAEPVAGYISLVQPTIAPLYHTRAFAESLLRWIDDSTDHYSFLRTFWRSKMMPRQKEYADFDSFWDHTLERGVIELAVEPAAPAAAAADWHAAAATLRTEQEQRGATGAAPDRYELALYESVGLRDGSHANNPWLQELPDPISKVTWDNVAAIAPSLAKLLGLSDGDIVTLTTAGGTIELPAFQQPGQHPRTISVALGYGRQKAGKAGTGVGANAFPLTSMVRGARRQWAGGVSMLATGRHQNMATTQRHFSMEDRPILLETTREELGRGEEAEDLPDLWTERQMGERSWGMTIDLNTCTGCSACVIACQAENNVPVIGKDQVERQRIMHWIRIDRYYAGSEDNPRSVHQPMMCQHCGHAPCETVCPVLATTTSSDGLNQQVYNRCIGTRYCANNCPYKVRRFNWYNYAEDPKFDYTMANPVARLVLNPDVTVRSRGVMEKCSMCVQRIAAGKNLAVKRGAAMKDGEVKTACQQVCPTDAITFGDLKDKASQVARNAKNKRNYRVLDDLGTRPNVSYLKKVRNGQST